MRLAASRRAIAAAFAPLLTLPLASRPAFSFDNALPAVAAERKAAEEVATGKVKFSPGPTPQGLGSKYRGDLNPCVDGKPHCFSSTTRIGEREVDTSKIGRDWIVPPWKYSGKSVLDALTDLKKAVDAYPPGQNGIDAGGFKTIKVLIPNAPDEVGYIYVQFEAQGGYIDDVEFAVLNGVCNVRTSSRLGYLDYGVNAIRYNWFATRLGAVKGWTTAPIRFKQEHLNYFGLNELSSDKAVGL